MTKKNEDPVLKKLREAAENADKEVSPKDDSERIVPIKIVEENTEKGGKVWEETDEGSVPKK